MTHCQRPLSISLVSLAAIAISGCHTSNASPSAEHPAAASAAAATAGLPNGDASLRDTILNELKKDKHIDPTGIRVTTTNGVVELTGKADNAVSKGRATRVAEAVRGVTSVNNRIEIAPGKRSDSEIEQDVKRALQFAAATAHMPIHVKVKDQVATLTGTVASWQEQRLAERVVDGVRGVRFTQNDLVTKRDKRDAGRIEGDVKSRLAWDVLVEHDPINVAVKDQRVTLSGTVGSAAEKTRAVDDAWVDGVAEVDASGVQVKPQDRPDPNLRSESRKTDQQIATAIKASMFYDPRVKSSNVNSSVSEGIATLSGTVDTLQAKHAAETIARNTLGVVDVKNQLALRAPESVSDRLLTAQLDTALAFDPLTDAHDVHVTVKDGHVTLSGSVGTSFERAQAFDDAARMPGVLAITDQLTVRDPSIPYVYTTWLDPFVPYAESWYIVGPRPTSPDATIQQRIRDEFSWNPFILPQDVQVKVESGKAILTGTVRSYRERIAAAVSAIRAGAVAVDNELKVG